MIQCTILFYVLLNNTILNVIFSVSIKRDKLNDRPEHRDEWQAYSSMYIKLFFIYIIQIH